MTDYSTDYSAPTIVYEDAVTPAASTKSPLISVLLAIPVVISLFSWLGGGTPFMTDLAFLWLACVLAGGLTREILYFPERMALGHLVLYGGALVWFVHDYFSNFFAIDFTSIVVPYTAETIAKGAFFTTFFILIASLGMMLPTGQWLPKLVAKLPVPAATNLYLIAVFGCAMIGFSTFVLFTSEPFYMAIWKSMFSMRGGGEGAAWTTGRDGNLNYSFGGYIVHLMQIGEIGAILGAFVVIMLRPGIIPSCLCILNWLIWTGLAFGTGSRGPVLAVTLPVLGLLFINYATIAMLQLQRTSKKAIFRTGVGMFVVLVAVQLQGSFRNIGITTADIKEVQIFKNQGNAMFTEGLIVYQKFPDEIAHPRDRFPGQGAVMFLPDTVARFAIGWIPRVIWKNKPGFSDEDLLVNQTITGGTAANTGGGTVATSISGRSYMRYGVAGVIEMGLLFGWLCACVQACLRPNLGRPFSLLLTLGLATYLFRCFRDLTPHDLYPLLIGSMGVYFVMLFVPKQQPAEYYPAA